MDGARESPTTAAARRDRLAVISASSPTSYPHLLTRQREGWDQRGRGGRAHAGGRGGSGPGNDGTAGRSPCFVLVVEQAQRHLASSTPPPPPPRQHHSHPWPPPFAYTFFFCVTQPRQFRLFRTLRLHAKARDEWWASIGGDENGRGRRRPLVAASVGPYGASLANGSEYTGDYGRDMVSYDIRYGQSDPRPPVADHRTPAPRTIRPPNYCRSGTTAA